MTNHYGKGSHIIHECMNYLSNQIINEAVIPKIGKYTTCRIRRILHLRTSGYKDLDMDGSKIDWLFNINNKKLSRIE